ncbi:PE-PPE domain-containing protein [Mycobacterium sp. Lab-001]|uniref:PE-PPE domain-containing protein n=1 Tax=Mycobacterium sp. Lab-001 TaxID=3410136 RepID=UPI003D165E5C
MVSGLLAGAAAGVLTITAATQAAFARADGTDVGLVIGGSGDPVPGSGYVELADKLYLDNPLMSTPNFPDVTFPGSLANGLFTPEGLYPLTGVNTLLFNYPTYTAPTDIGFIDPNGQPVEFPAGFPTLSSSVGQGIAILNSNIEANEADGLTSTVFGYSQSATLASYEMQLLDPTGANDASEPVNFLLIGDPSAPNGGLLARFPDAVVPTLGTVFGSSTPADDFTTVIYSQEYDGFADFPQYPLNFLADLNAFLGIDYVHGHYLTEPVTGNGPTPDQIANALPLATEGATDTHYYMIPVSNLPLLDPVREIPVIGQPIADLLQPDLSLIVNLGYDNPDPYEGWSSGPANVTTPFGLGPSPHQLLGALQQLPGQTELGVNNFIGDFTGTGPHPVSLAALPDSAAMTSSLSSVSDSMLAAMSNPTAPLTNAIYTLSSAASTAYGTLLPTTDILNAVATALPAYDITLFTQSLAENNLLDAVGLPLAADTALFTLAGGFEYEVLVSAAASIIGDLGSLIP